MRQEIKLFIEDREIEFAEPPAILFTYQENDLTNPTVVKNHYSKTVNIEGTPLNNDTFGHIWDLSRYTSHYEGTNLKTGYNASKKANFKLFVNGELYESGYVKLNKVNRTGKEINYDITLLGGIGDFFYQMQFDENGNKLRLSDLTFLPSSETYYGQTFTYPEGDEHEFDFTINKETLAQAWNCINWEPDYDAGEEDSTRHWKYINFAPCYEGDPNFSTDKVLINFNNAAIFSAETSGETTYTSVDGYGIGTLPDKMDTWATRDIRSYLQRPVLRMKGVIGAIKNYAEKKGFQLDLSSKFFSEENPYYEDTWMTCPLLTEIKLTGTDTSSAGTSTHTWVNGNYVEYTNVNHVRYMIDFTPELPVKAGHIECTIRFGARSNDYIAQNMFSSAWVGGERNFSAYGVQLVAHAGEDWNSDVVAASPSAWLTSKVGEDYLKPSETYYNPSSLNTEINPVFGYFEPDGNGEYVWSEPFTLSMDLPQNARGFAFVVQAVANLTTWEKWGRNWFLGKYKLQESGVTYGYRQRRFYTSTNLPELNSGNSNYITHYRGSMVGDAKVTTSIDTLGYSGAHVTKKLLLDTKYTPCDYLLSFAKIFGLYFLKNPWDNVIHIMTRDEFYRTDDITDISDKIDRSELMEVNPDAFESKFYDFALKSVGGEFADKYEYTYSRVYGSQRVDTGYEFETEPKQIYSGNCFNSCVCGVQKSKYYLAPLRFSPSNEMPAYVLQGFKYNLYHTQDSGNYDTYVVDMTTRTDNAEPLKTDKYYDLFNKPQFRDVDGKAVKGENCLLFFDGNVDCVNDSGTTIPYWITDDMRAMAELNDGDTCWIYTEDEFDEGGGQIAIRRTNLPQFTRYITNQSGTITYSLDFGEPKQLYSFDITTNPTSTIYSKYWKDYIEDMYNEDTRVVNAKVLLEQRPNPDYLRRFYWFDNSLWRINKISDYNISSFDTTQCEFVKVHHTENYGAPSVSSIKLTSNKYDAATTGETLNIYIDCSGNWSFGGDITAFITSSPTSGTGDATLAVSILPNNSSEDREVRLRATCTDDGTFSEISILQRGSVLSLQRQAGNADISWTGGTAIYVVKSTLPWEFNGGNSGLFTATPSSGTGTDGTTVIIDVVPNDSGHRVIQLRIQNSAGASISAYLGQEGQGAPEATISPAFLYGVPKSGGVYKITATTNFDDWSTSSVGTYVPSISPTTGNGGETILTFTFPANTGDTIASGTTSLLYGNTKYGFFYWEQDGPFSMQYHSGLSTLGRDQYNIDLSTLAAGGFLNATGGTVNPVSSIFRAGTRWLYFDDTVACITNHAFENAKQEVMTTAQGLSSIEIPSSVTAVTDYAFAGCTDLSAVTLSGVSYFGEGAFSGCTGLSTLHMGTGVTYLGYRSFSGCSGLIRIDYDGTVAQWNAIPKDSGWTDQSGFYIQCSDGQVTP